MINIHIEISMDVAIISRIINVPKRKDIIGNVMPKKHNNMSKFLRYFITGGIPLSISACRMYAEGMISSKK